MKNLTDREYLLERQYGDDRNLRARMAVHQCFSTNPQGLPRWFFEQLRLPEQARVLEVGCGPGGYWVEGAELIPASWQITVSDLSPGMVARARERLATLDRPVTVVQADVQELPFDGGGFDAVVANYMLYHVPDRKRALKEIHRVLAAGGQLFAITNGAGHMRELHELLAGVAPGTVRNDEEFGFSTDNGAAQLAPWFDDVRLVPYPDSLQVTEAEPLIAYAHSYLSGISPDQEAVLRERIEARITESGVFQITKNSGLFIGVKR